MKPGLKVFVSVLLIAAVVCLGIAVTDHAHSGKWLSSAGLMFDIVGIAQLDIVGFFDHILERYSDEKKYPMALRHILRGAWLRMTTPIGQYAVGLSNNSSINIGRASTCLSLALPCNLQAHGRENGLSATQTRHGGKKLSSFNRGSRTVNPLA
jgi:hypothetical protein